jgi:CheY-like chemotaxis protein
MSRSEDPSSRLRVLIVDRHAVSRAAIRALLKTEGLDVVADVSELDEAIALGREALADVAIVDIGTGARAVPDGAGPLARLPGPPSIVLTSSTPVDAEPGAYAFLAKSDISAEHLRRCMKPSHHDTREPPHMSMQAYLDNIAVKTGKTIDELLEHVRAEGLLEPGVKTGQLVTWLGNEYGLGHGHAMAVVASAKKRTTPVATADEKVTRHFAGKKVGWRPAYDEVVRTVRTFGSDTDVDAGATYLSLRRSGKKFAIVSVTSNRLDIGIKLRDIAPVGRLESAGSWNRMVTHRVRIHDPAEVDQELFGWLEQAYARA